MISIAHLSDLHATPVQPAGVRPLLNKRFFGWLSWRTKRSKIYRPQVLHALIDDLREVAPDQIVVTGDLTNVALEEEFVAARGWLERLGPADRVSVIPGNHDAYVALPREVSWALWDEYMRSDAAGRDEAAPAGGEVEFPTLRVRDGVAIVGVSSAVATPVFQASGSVGAAQLGRLEALLAKLADSGLFRLLLIHHPPVAGLVSARRALRDGEAFRALLRRTGADLVLHGHMHRASFAELEGPHGSIPSVGVPASSNGSDDPAKRSRYHVYGIERVESGARFRVHVRTRGYDVATGGFGDEGERLL